MVISVGELKQTKMSAIEGERDELRRISEEIWKHPELNYEEHTAHRLLTDYLGKNGFTVERGYCSMPTAFKATFGSGQPNVCIICEYDALPNIGHACGHNLIAEAGIAAGIGVKAFIESHKGTSFTGTVTVMGTPAEEGGGGKVFMIERGAFNGVDVAIMAHPGPGESIININNARAVLDIEFTGKAAHAAAFPWEGVNALDAAVLAYTNVSALRQQMKPTWRVHGVFTNGGVKPNIIPEKAALKYYVRAPTVVELNELKKKVVACFNGAAQATGCTVKITTPIPAYENIRSNSVLARLYGHNLTAEGITDFEVEVKAAWSSDMGNVSHVVPSLHPGYAIGGGKVYNHTHQFTSVTNTSAAHAKTLQIGKVMANTCIDVLNGGEELLREIKEDFNKDVVAIATIT